MNLQDCDFCAIARGDQEAEVVGAGVDWIAFFPLRPATPGHTLVIPREHASDLWETNDQTGAALTIAAMRIGRAMQAALEPEGMNLITSAGTTAEQTVFHLHLHVVPRWSHDGFGQIWPPASQYEGTDLGDIAARIRAALPNGNGV
jgi:histidine triad (HIT) family protein